MAEAGRYHSLRRKLTLTVLLVSFTPLLAVTIIASRQYNANYKAKVRAHLMELVQKHQQNIDSYLDEKLAGVLVLADLMGQTGIPDERELKRRHRAMLARHGSDFVDLGLADPQGILRAYAGPFKPGEADYSTAGWYAEARTRKIYISDVFLGPRGIPYFIIAVAFDADGQEWILRTTLDFAAFNELIEDIHVGETGQAFIINGAGEFQTTPKNDLTWEVPFLLQLLESQGSLGPRQMPGTGSGTKSGRVSVYRGPNPATGRDTILVSAPLKHREWALIFQQDAADAYQELRRTRNLVLLVLAAGGLAIAMMAVLLPGRLVRRLEVADRDSSLMSQQVVQAGKLASIGELAAGVAHEINNPVTIMVQEAGWIGDLLDDGLTREQDVAEVRRALNQIDVQGARCRDITHNLLRFSRKVSSSIEEVQLNELLGLGQTTDLTILTLTLT